MSIRTRIAGIGRNLLNMVAPKVPEGCGACPAEGCPPGPCRLQQEAPRTESQTVAQLIVAGKVVTEPRPAARSTTASRRKANAGSGHYVAVNQGLNRQQRRALERLQLKVSM